jgi:hypothetical protein
MQNATELTTKDEDRLLIIKLLARYKTNKQVRQIMLDKTGREYSLQYIALQNPEASGKALAAHLKDYFHKERQQYAADLTAEPLAVKRARLHHLEQQHENVRQALQQLDVLSDKAKALRAEQREILQQAADEMKEKGLSVGEMHIYQQKTQNNFYDRVTEMIDAKGGK